MASHTPARTGQRQIEHDFCATFREVFPRIESKSDPDGARLKDYNRKRIMTVIRSEMDFGALQQDIAREMQTTFGVSVPPNTQFEHVLDAAQKALFEKYDTAAAQSDFLARTSQRLDFSYNLAMDTPAEALQSLLDMQLNEVFIRHLVDIFGTGDGQSLHPQLTEARLAEIRQALAKSDGKASNIASLAETIGDGIDRLGKQRVPPVYLSLGCGNGETDRKVLDKLEENGHKVRFIGVDGYSDPADFTIKGDRPIFLKMDVKDPGLVAALKKHIAKGAKIVVAVSRAHHHTRSTLGSLLELCNQLGANNIVLWEEPMTPEQHRNPYWRIMHMANDLISNVAIRQGEFTSSAENFSVISPLTNVLDRFGFKLEHSTSKTRPINGIWVKESPEAMEPGMVRHLHDAPETEARMAGLFDTIADLKTVKRAGWVRAGVPPHDIENVAEHSYGMAMLGLMLAPRAAPHVNPHQVVDICLAHDLIEGVVGDITPHDRMPEAAKHDLERAAHDRLAAEHGFHEVRALWRQYEDAADANNTDAEAKFTKELDRLHMGLVGNVYAKRFPDIDFSGFDRSTRKALRTGGLVAFYDDLKAGGSVPSEHARTAEAFGSIFALNGIRHAGLDSAGISMSVAEQSYEMAMLSVAAAPLLALDLDRRKITGMSLVQGWSAKQGKAFRDFPEVFSLWSEYDAGLTREAQFVRQLAEAHRAFTENRLANAKPDADAGAFAPPAARVAGHTEEYRM